jgi:Family of unknown function (DUF6209)
VRQRLHAGKPAEITFTCDFHELVSGDLRPAGLLLLRYDPSRIVPADEPYRFGDPDRPVTVHIRFREGEAPTDVRLRSTSGIDACPDVDLTGQGSMLSGWVVLPDDAEHLEVWFSYPTASGAIRYDSDYGANYRFGFACREIDVVQATVTRQPDQLGDRFELAISTTQAVEDVTVAFSLVGDAACDKHELRLQRVSDYAAQEQWALWSAAVDLPHGATARFKVCYWIGGRRLIDDNTGAFYLAPEPDPDNTPPPPPALLEAAAAWS